MRVKLRSIVEDNTSRSGKLFDYLIQVLILLSLIAFSVETLPNISTIVKFYLDLFETFCVVIFSIEYLIRVYVAKKPLKYIFSFYGIIDLLAILPFYLRGTLDFRALRAFRVFRIFRALKLIRYNKALHRFHLAAKLVKEEIVLFLIVTAIFVFIASAGIYYFENDAQPEVFASIFHSAWWAVVTLTTVGYGDVYPITTGGKIFTFCILIIGVGIVTIPAGLVATSLSKAREIEEKENETLS
ncbi:ion transporter [Formosa algae]|uniref:Voltage-gated potassium channel n=1 Tax=Formosa algae TaxID=225843 RepID=A0A9X0YLC2_9FLAO|nr:ion transporter [Formosa algae]MBP1839369.1 voltage-gated potassium channel [Formosa algae]MDQ0334673.1 voltage-gated potassium channel [Formosa algae]OEI81295.1 voltage-gated potassium channel [Formosa algae]